MPVTRTVDLTRLDAGLAGRAIGPGDPAYDAARAGFNLAVDLRPAAVVLAHDADDVERAVRFAAEHGLRMAAQGTGHGAAALPALDDAILVRTAALDRVEVDAAARVARLGAGATWGAVSAAATPAGLAGLAGTSGTVGVAGYTLGGGAGWLARAHGLGAWTLRAADAVTVDGERVRAEDGGEHADLLWALRGAGSVPVIVTGLEVGLIELGGVRAGGLWWPLERAAEVWQAWADWVPGLPDAVTSLVRVVRYPPLPDLPPHLRGQSFAIVEAAVLGGAEQAAGLLAPLRALRPDTDTFRTMPAAELASVHGDPQQPVPGLGAGTLLRELPAAGVESLMAAAGPGAECALVSLEVRHLGGALRRGAPVDAILDRLSEPFAVFGVGIAAEPASRAATEASLASLSAAVAPWRSERVLPTLADGPFDADATFGAAAARLRAVAERYDPAGRLVRSHR